MTGFSLDNSGQARLALQDILRDYGLAGIDDDALIDRHLPDLLPDAPREAGLLRAAAAAKVGHLLTDRFNAKIPPEAAVRDVAAMLADRTAFDASACLWVVVEYAAVLGHTVDLAPSSVSGPPVSGPPGAAPPVVGPPAAGPPFGGSPAAGSPFGGSPIAGQPGSGQPISGPPISGPPVSGTPVSGSPVSGSPVSGQPVSGQPISGQPQQQRPGQAPGGYPPPSQPGFPTPPGAGMAPGGMPPNAGGPANPLGTAQFPAGARPAGPGQPLPPQAGGMPQAGAPAYGIPGQQQPGQPGFGQPGFGRPGFGQPGAGQVPNADRTWMDTQAGQAFAPGRAGPVGMPPGYNPELSGQFTARPPRSKVPLIVGLIVAVAVLATIGIAFALTSSPSTCKTTSCTAIKTPKPTIHHSTPPSSLPPSIQPPAPSTLSDLIPSSIDVADDCDDSDSLISDDESDFYHCDDEVNGVTLWAYQYADENGTKAALADFNKQAKFHADSQTGCSATTDDSTTGGWYRSSKSNNLGTLECYATDSTGDITYVWTDWIDDTLMIALSDDDSYKAMNTWWRTNNQNGQGE